MAEFRNDDDSEDEDNDDDDDNYEDSNDEEDNDEGNDDDDDCMDVVPARLICRLSAHSLKISRASTKVLQEEILVWPLLW